MIKMEIQEGLTGTAFENGYKIVQNRGLAIIGMSPGNSYFKKDRIDELLKYCTDCFSQVRIMIADKPAEHTYKAMGYDFTEAERKARLNGNTLQNHSQKSIDGIIGDIKLVEWEDEIAPNETYQRECAKIQKMYQDNNLFRHDIRETTKSVLDGKLKEKIEIEEAIDEGVHYLLKELAFVLASPEMFDVNGVTYVYHNNWLIFEDLINGKYDGKMRNDLGFVIIG
jgi:cyclo(L-tyrosyl-L-tyrosyl) synthase